jgi:hypothetical protein
MPITIDFANASIPLAKVENVTDARILGRVEGAPPGTGVATQLTGTQATTLLDEFTSALKGLVPASGGDATHVLHADGSWSEAGGTPDDIDITGDGTVASPLELVPASIGFVSGRSLGIVMDGVTDDSVAFRAAIVSAGALGATLQLGEGTLLVGRDGSSAYCINVAASNVTIQGVPGKTFIKATTGMPDATVPVLHINGLENVTLRDIIIDGNWGNAVTEIAPASDDAAASTGTWNVLSTTNFPSSGTMYLVTPTATQTITYSGKTSTTFTGCSGGTGTLKIGMVIGYLDANTGINHTTQTDPKNHGVMIRGSRNVVLDNVKFRNCYGDMVWIGMHATTAGQKSHDIYLNNCVGDICARNAISVAQPAEGVYVTGCSWSNAYQVTFDCEPELPYTTKHIHLVDSYFGIWWNPNDTAVRDLNVAVRFQGSSTTFLRDIQIVRCQIDGSIWGYDAAGVNIHDNDIRCDHAGYSLAPIYLDHAIDDLTVDKNRIYDRTGTSGASNHIAAISVMRYSLGSGLYQQPVGVQITRNKIHARNGRDGIYCYGTGGYTNASSGLFTAESNTATSVTALTVVRTGAGWTVNKWTGARVRIGTAVAKIISNTSDTLTIGAFSLSGWFDPTGANAATPSAGAYVIYWDAGMVDISDNEIDCGDDGNGAGRYGIQLGTDVGGMRAAIRRNKLRNCTNYGIYILSITSAIPIRYLEIADNVGWDDQASATFSNLIRIFDPCYITKFIMRNNTANGTSFPTALSGVSASTTLKHWIVNDGMCQSWMGYGLPEGAVTAPIGSVYQQVDATVGASVWTKDSGSGTTGWVAIGERARPNFVRNSGFWFAQRQAPGTLATYDTATGRAFCADGWAITNETASAQYIRVDALTPETGLAARFYGSFTKITNTGKFIVSQVIEGTEVAKLRGRTVRLQARIKGTASQTVRFGLAELAAAGTVDTIPATFATISNTGSVDHTLGTNLAYIAPTAGYVDNTTITGSALSCSVTTAWQRFGGVFTVPSDCKNLVVMVWTNAPLTATNGFSLSEVTLVDGPEIQVWTPGSLTDELDRVRRYYQKTFGVDAIPAQNAGVTTGELVSGAWKAGATASAAIIPWRFAPEMRAAPTITTYSPAAASAEVRRTGGGADFTATAAGGTTAVQTVITATGDAGGAIGDATAIHATADAEL